SYLVTFQLYQSGLDIEEIQRIRSLKKTTVCGHLIQALKEGYSVNIEDFVSPEKMEQIQSVQQELDTYRLKPIKEALPEEIDYDEIRFVMAWINRENSSE